MRKILFGAIIVVLLIVTGIVMYKGTGGGLNIWGFTSISEENAAIDSKNLQLATLINTKYPSTLATLNAGVQKLQETKKEYENQAILLADSKYYKQVEKYKHEFILVKIGNYADDNNVDIRTVVTNSDVSGLYDINFTITGRYADVANYIYDIENDSTLGFKIEDFTMKPATAVSTYHGSPNSSVTTYTESDGGDEGDENDVSANFNCKEISIDLKWIDENESIIPGIITRGNPYVDTMTTLTDDYKNEKLNPQVNKNSTNSTSEEPKVPGQ